MKEIKEIIPTNVRSVNRYMVTAGSVEKPEEYAIIEYVPTSNYGGSNEYTILLPTITPQGIGMGEVSIKDATSLSDALRDMTKTVREHADTMQKIINRSKLAVPPGVSTSAPKLVVS